MPVSHPPNDSSKREANICSCLSTDMISSLILLPFLAEPNELARISQTCRVFREAVNKDAVWHQVAKNRYGDFVVVLTKREIVDAPWPCQKKEEAETYFFQEVVQPQTNVSWKSIVAEDNRRIACPTLRMPPKACNWRYNNDDTPFFIDRRLFYCCVIEGIKWSRSSECLLVYINVRGERDLRAPKPNFTCSKKSKMGWWHHSVFTGSTKSTTGWWHSALKEETPGHYKGCIGFCAGWFERPGTFRFCYNTDFGDYEQTELFTLPELPGIGIPSDHQLRDPSYSYPYLKHLFGLNEYKGYSFGPRHTKLFTLPELPGIGVPSDHQVREPPYSYPYLKHLSGLKESKPFFTPLYKGYLFGPYRTQTPEEEREIFKKFVPLEFIERDQGEPNAWWV